MNWKKNCDRKFIKEQEKVINELEYSFDTWFRIYSVDFTMTCGIFLGVSLVLYI